MLVVISKFFKNTNWQNTDTQVTRESQNLTASVLKRKKAERGGKEDKTKGRKKETAVYGLGRKTTHEKEEIK
jgi:hypothetical protein